MEDHNNWTGRDQLVAVLRHASTRYPSFYYQQQAYGAVQTFESNGGEIESRPRYFLIGDKSTTDGRKMTMASQNKLVCAIQGGKGARLKDASTIQRRQEGWKDWTEKKSTSASLAFQEHEFPAIQLAFGQWFDDPLDSDSVADEICGLLYQSNLIPRAVNEKHSQLNDNSKSHNQESEREHERSEKRKRQRLGRPPKSLSAMENDYFDPWRLQRLSSCSVLLLLAQPLVNQQRRERMMTSKSMEIVHRRYHLPQNIDNHWISTFARPRKLLTWAPPSRLEQQHGWT